MKPWWWKKVGIFSLYLLRVSFSVRLNRIIILVERLMSLNGNLFSSLSFNRVWTTESHSFISNHPIHFYSGLHGPKVTKTNVLRVPDSSQSPTRVRVRDRLANRIRIWLWLANVLLCSCWERGITNVLTHFVSVRSLFFCWNRVRL